MNKGGKKKANNGIKNAVLKAKGRENNRPLKEFKSRPARVQIVGAKAKGVRKMFKKVQHPKNSSPTVIQLGAGPVYGNKEDSSKFQKKRENQINRDSRLDNQADQLLDIESAIEMIAPNENTFPLTYLLPGMYTLFQNMVSAYAARRPNVLAPTASSATVYSPVTMVGYLVWALFTILRKDGVFRQSGMTNAFSDFPPDYKIPQAVAEALKYVRKYSRAGTSSRFDDNVLTALPTYPATNGAIKSNNAGFAQSGATLSVCGCTLATATGTEHIYSVGSGGTWADVYAAAANISQRWAADFPCANLLQLPEFAPDASAYTGLQTDAVYSFTPDYDEEVAYIMNGGSVSSGANVCETSYVKPSPAVPGNTLSVQNFWIEIFNRCTFIPNARKYEVLKTCRIPRIKYIFGFDNQITLDAYKLIINQLYFIMGGSLNDNGANFTDWAVFYTCLMSPVIAKTARWSYSVMGDIGPYTSSEFLGLPVPLICARFINEIGMVQKSGRLLLPWVKCTGTGQTWQVMFTTGANQQKLATNSTPNPWYINNSAAYATGFTLTTMDNVAWALVAAQNYGLTPIALVPLLLSRYRKILKTLGLQGLVVETDGSKILGGVLAYTSQDFTLTSGYGVIQFASATSTAITIAQLTVSAIGSTKPLTSTSVSGAQLYCPYGILYNTALAVSSVALMPLPYKCIGDTGVPINVEEIIVQTVTDDNVQLLANLKASKNQQLKEWRGQAVDSSMDGGFLTDIVDSIMVPVLSEITTAGCKLMRPISKAVDELDSSFSKMIPTRTLSKIGGVAKELAPLMGAVALL